MDSKVLETIEADIEIIHHALIKKHEINELTPDSPRLYHYTSLPNSLEILKSKKLRFTNIRYLNDPTELQNGLDIAEKITDKLISSLEEEHLKIILQLFKSRLRIGFSSGKQKENELLKARHALQVLGSNGIEDLMRSFQEDWRVYIFCLSEHNDDLRQWLPYADNGKGVALGFDGMKNFQHNIHDNNVDAILLHVSYAAEKKKEEFLEAYLMQVLEYYKSYNIHNYNKKEYGSIFTKFMETVYGLALTDLVACKNEHYEDEKEWRLYIARKGQQKKQEFFCRDNIIKPCFDIDFNFSALKEIHLGPCCDEELNSAALELLTGDNIEINKSNIKYRG